MRSGRTSPCPAPPRFIPRSIVCGRRRAERETKFILAEAGEYHLDAAHFQVDVDEFDAALSQARAARDETQARHWYERAVALYQDEYLDNLYYDWLLPERRRLNQAAFAALRALAKLYAQANQFENALALTQRALKLDPLLEELHCDLMRYYAALGNRPAVVRQYQLLTQQLCDELGLVPTPATQEYYAQVMAKAA